MPIPRPDPARRRDVGTAVGRWLGALVLAFDAVAGATRTAAARLAHRARPALRVAGWWLAWLLVATVDATDRGVRALARAYREGTAPWLDEARERAAATLRAARTHAWTATERAAPAARDALRRLPATRHALRRLPAATWAGRGRLQPGQLALVLVMVAGSLGATRAFGVPAVQIAAGAVDVDVTEPGALPPLEERSVVVDAEGALLAVSTTSRTARSSSWTRSPSMCATRSWPPRTTGSTTTTGSTSSHWAARPARTSRRPVSYRAVRRSPSSRSRTSSVTPGRWTARSRSCSSRSGWRRRTTRTTCSSATSTRCTSDRGRTGSPRPPRSSSASPPAELTVGQAALLAGQIRAPAAVDARDDPQAAADRRAQVLGQKVAAGYLDHDEAARASGEPVEVAPPLHTEAPDEPYVVEAVKREFLANPVFGETREERLEALFTGGLRIETTLHQRLQTLARDAVGAHVEALGGPTAALAAVQPGTGRMLAMTANGDFDETKFDLATQGRRQPGSAFKTFALIAALEAGVDPDTRLDGDGPEEHELPNGQVWTVDNFAGSEHGDVDLREALVSSVNTAFAELTLEVGHEHVVDVANRLGIGEEAFGEASTHGPSVALGGLTHGVSPVEMAAAYAALGNDGRYAAPFLVERVVAPDGDVLFAREIEPQQAIEPAVAGATLEMLADVVAEGTGQAARLPGWPVAGKTGTTQNSADAWFAGTTPPLAAAVWVGHPDQQTPVPGLTGGGAAAPLWRDFVAAALDDAEPTGFGG